MLGLNLNDYFLKRHLVDQQPVEPMPPMENPLETTQNEDVKIRHEIKSIDSFNESSAF